MSVWKQLLLSAYYYGTLPGRWWNAALRAADGQAPVLVLFYHRIADDCANEWTASNRTFARQMYWLKKHFDMVSLGEAQRRVSSGRNCRPCVSVTFDDGYADNCQQALPLLIREQIPCTYFVASRHILDGQPFAHDVALGRALTPNTPEQIRSLAAAGIEIGAHTRHHADLGKITDEYELHDELVGSKHDLEEITGKPVRYFAFPFGQHKNLNPDAFAMAKDAGFEGVCSAYGGYNFAGDDPFHLQRIHVDDDLIRLKNWVTVDARKLAMADRYEYRSIRKPTATFIGEPVGAQGVATS
jgi:peptidoglycan/xylan/chitin deacetylase (PgdA/CDA1 family)